MGKICCRKAVLKNISKQREVNEENAINETALAAETRKVKQIILFSRDRNLYPLVKETFLGRLDTVKHRTWVLAGI